MTFGERIRGARAYLDTATGELRSALHENCVRLVQTNDLGTKGRCARSAWALARGLEILGDRLSRLPDVHPGEGITACPATDDAHGPAFPPWAKNSSVNPEPAANASMAARLAIHRAGAFTLSDFETAEAIKEVMDLLDVLVDVTDERSQGGQIAQWPITLPFEPPPRPGRPINLRLADSAYHPESIPAQLHDFAFRIELCATEVCAAMIAATPELSIDLHIDLARQVRDEMRHFELFIEHVGRRGYRLEDFPIRFEVWDKFKCGRNIAEWLVIEQRLGEGTALDTAKAVHDRLVAAQEHEVAGVFEFVTADEVQHVKTGNRWLAALVGDDASVQSLEDTVLTRLEEAGLQHVYKPVTAHDLRRSADFSVAEIERLASRKSLN